LETSKEELQSINEELQTVNSELKLKLETISRAHSDLQNLMAAADFGTLFLDSSLRIKRFTDHVTQLFSITPTDEGRPITDFAHQLEYGNLTADARGVLANLAPLQREVPDRKGHWYDIRMRPYRTVDNKIDGVVITFVDVTERRHVEETLRQNERQLQRLKRLIELSRDPIFHLAFRRRSHRVESRLRAALRLYAAGGLGQAQGADAPHGRTQLVFRRTQGQAGSGRHLERRASASHQGREGA
jgi:two-component system CheB/CheR fusion protein